MKNLKQVLFSAAILVLASFTAFAQKGTVKGNVKDKETGEPVPFLSVYIQGQTSGAMTDFDGNYSIELEPGTYELVFSSVEYGKHSENITIAAGQTVTIDQVLSTSVVETQTIVVKSDKYAKAYEDVISSMEVIKPNIIENKASTDVKTALEQAPGLTIVDNEPQLRAGSGYSFGAGSRVMILVDDLPLLSGDAGRPSWGYIPVENIEQIEVIKGASSVLYGSAALNGVINVRTAYPKAEPTTKINLITGMYGAPHDKVAKWWDRNFPFYSNMTFLHSRRVKCKNSQDSRFSFVLGGNLFTESSYLGPEASDVTEKVPVWNALLSSGTINATQYKDSLDMLSRELKEPSYTHRARLTFNTAAKAKKLKGFTYGLNGNVMYGTSSSSLLWQNNTDGKLRAYTGAFTNTKQTTFNVDPYFSYFDQKGNKYSFNSRVFYQNNNNDNNQANKAAVMYGEFRYLKTFEKIRDFTLSTGLMGQYSTGESQLYAGGDLDSLVSSGEQKRRSSSNIALYAQLDKKFWEKLSVTLGARWEYFNIEGDVDNKPVFRAGLNYRVAKATYLRASFGQGFRFPTIAERYIETTVGGVPIIANPDLGSEASWNLEAGAKQGIKIGKFLGYLDVAGFVQTYHDYVEFIAAKWKTTDFTRPGGFIEKFGFGFQSVNTNDTRVSGVEATLMGQGNFTDNFGINILAGYTWAHPVSLDPRTPFATNADGVDQTYINTSTDTANYILKYRYEHLAKVDIEFIICKKFSIGASYRYYSYMQNVDAIFYNSTFTTFTGLNLQEYREANETGEHIVDLRVSYEIAKHSKLAFIINNVNNREYALRPLAMDPPRTFALQYTLTL